VNYLVTGGAGFIGTNIVEELVKKGENVRVMDNFSTGKRENLSEFLASVELVEGDVRSYHIVREAVEGIDVILHEAALPSVPRSIRDPLTTNEVNVIGTLNVLQAARDARVKRIVFASSSSVYGDNPELPKRESLKPSPLSPYAVSKLAGEQYCQAFSKIYKMETICLRYFNVFGPRQDPSSAYAAVIPKFIQAAVSDTVPVIYGDGEQSRDFTFVSNIVDANLRAASADCPPGTVMNIACGQTMSLNTLVKHLGGILNTNIKPRYEQARPGDVLHSLASIETAQKMLGYVPRVAMAEGLQRTVAWYLGRQSASGVNA
jgi:nucleoside-diphosphate-sugar epimerase